MGRNFFQRELQALPLCFVKSLKCNEVSPSIETKSSQPVQSGTFLMQGSKCNSGSEINFEHVFVNLCLN